MSNEIAKIYRSQMEETCISDPWTNHAWGALVGAWCGDAAGAIVEGFGRGASDRTINECLAMVGGGVHNTDPGAITDDGELTATLLRALTPYNASYDFPLNEVAKAYRTWFRSNPFDVGYTCRTAFDAADVADEEVGQKMLDMTARRTQSLDSQANGALMRIMPVAVWCAAHARSEGLKTEHVIATIREHAATDARLSHPNQICVEANILYCIAAVHLINNPGDGLGALTIVETEIQERCTTAVVDWYYTSTSLSNDNFCVNGGHVKHAFRAAFYHLRRRSTYDEAIRDVLRHGGDTDTNCAIVGGLIGALHGFQLIPDTIKSHVLSYDCMRAHNNHRRPETYSVFRSWPFLLEMIPKGGVVEKPVSVREVRVVKLDQDQDQDQDQDHTYDLPTDLDSVVTSVIGKFAERARFGKAKYGVTLDRDDLGVLDWIQHAQEEHMDAILYLEKLKRVISAEK